MSSLAQKQPFIKSLSQHTESRFASLSQVLKKSVPATIVDMDPSGTIATVQFEIDSQFTLPKVKMPIYGPQFVRWPLKKGDKGVVLSSDLALGGMSGLGEGTATLTPMFNLSSGTFFPIGNTAFSDTDNPDATVIYGPDGVIIRDSKKQSVMTIDPVSMKYALNGHTYVTITGDEILLDYALTQTEEVSISSVGPSTQASSAQTIASVLMYLHGIKMSAYGHTVTMNESGVVIDNGDGTFLSMDATGLKLQARNQTLTIDSNGIHINAQGNSTANFGSNGQIDFGANGGTVTRLMNSSGILDSTPWGSIHMDSGQVGLYMTGASLQVNNNAASLNAPGTYVQLGSNAAAFSSAGSLNLTAPNGNQLFLDPGTAALNGSNPSVAGRTFMLHTHFGVQSGGSNSQGVN